MASRNRLRILAILGTLPPMLASMRQHSRSLLIYVIFGILIAVFVINFGPSSGSGCVSTMSESQAATVAGRPISTQDLVHSMQLLGLGGGDGERARGAREFLLDQLIRRELLAHEAERQNIRVSDEEIGERISHGRIAVAGQPWNLAQDPRFAAIYKDGFDYAQWKQVFCEYFLHTTPKRYIDELRRELLAEKMRMLLMASTQISPEEARLRYEAQERKVKLGYVRFSSRAYEGEINPTGAEVAAFAQQHADKVKKAFEANHYRYKGVPKEVKVVALLLDAGEKASEEKVAALKTRAEELRKRAASASSFGSFAATYSTDARTKKSPLGDGVLGWVRKGGSGLGEAFEEAVLNLAPGTLSEVIKTDDGFAVAKVEAVRQGDLKLEEVSEEIARELLIEEQTSAKVKAAAEQALKRAKDNGKLSAVFPKKPTPTDDAAKGDDEAQRPKAEEDEKRAYYQETEPFARSRDILTGVGVSEEAVQAAFVQMKPGEIAGPFPLKDSGTNLVVLQLIERKEPDLATFTKDREQIQRRFEMEKGYRVFGDWSQKRCLEAKQAGHIMVNQDLFSMGPDAPAAPPYSPCLSLGMM